MGAVFPDRDYADEQPPRYVCDIHKYADDAYPCDLCADGVDEVPITNRYRIATYEAAVRARKGERELTPDEVRALLAEIADLLRRDAVVNE